MHITNQEIAKFDDIIASANVGVPLVAVFCGSRCGIKESYVKTAYQLGESLAKQHLGLVYGGACIGVMGAVADGVMDAGGVSVGVIPTFLLDKEVAHPNLTHLYTTDTMHTRKALMAQFAAAFVVLPGGLGTLEEIMEIATWRQLRQHDKPMILVNIDGFFDGLIAHLTHTVNQGFMAQADLQNFIVCNDIKAALVHLQSMIGTPRQMDVKNF